MIAPQLEVVPSFHIYSADEEKKSREQIVDCPKPLVVCVGLDHLLNFTRSRILASAGYRVITGTPGMIFPQLGADAPRLFVLCHTIDPEVSAILAATAKWRYPKCKVLLLTEGAPPDIDRSIFDGTLPALEGPDAFLAHTIRLLRTKPSPGYLC